ncbi:class I SAM-dependent methyltransferase [Micromonospora haikouensis]|uniref:class I SAM-dependent methyltransferase n=1 Tax=Micromonospora haikouensis TaxID=686309 RepID=UPI0037BC9663
MACRPPASSPPPGTLPPGSFDAIICLYALIHLPLPEQPRLVGRIATWLRPGGWLLATVGDSAWTGTEKNWLGGPAAMWWSQADASTYRSWLREAGGPPTPGLTRSPAGSPPCRAGGGIPAAGYPHAVDMAGPARGPVRGPAPPGAGSARVRDEGPFRYLVVCGVLFPDAWRQGAGACIQ